MTQGSGRKPYKSGPRVKPKKNTVGSNTRVWMQFPKATVTVALGHPTMENKATVPESWEVGHLPVYFGWNGASLCLTDMTESELDQLVVAFNMAINAARPICKLLDDNAYQALQSGVELDEVPKRILRGPAPQLVRDIDTVLRSDPYDQANDETENDELAS